MAFAAWTASFSRCLLFHRCRRLHPIEVALESIYMRRPEAPELSEPILQFLKWFRFQPVQPALCVHAGLYETGLAEHSEVLGDRRLRHAKSTLDIAHRLL